MTLDERGRKTRRGRQRSRIEVGISQKGIGAIAMKEKGVVIRRL